ncbi:MAG: hypothetical protein RH942_01685 [Kiloniellaceae bacterium]
MAIFADVVQKNIKVRFFYDIYERVPVFVKSLLLLIYGLKCYLSIGWRRAGTADLAVFASYPNEHVAIRHVLHHVRSVTVGEMAASKRNCFRLSAFRALPAYLVSAPRLLRIARMLARRFHFMPACRIFSTMTFYARFLQLLERPGVKAVLIANHYSPECLALAAAAHRLGRKVLFTNHANATWDEGYVPPLMSDLAAVTSQAVLDIYRQHTGTDIRAVFVPLPAPQRPMQYAFPPAQPITVGIFLTALTNMERLGNLVTELEQIPNLAGILIRPHPAKVIKEDLSGLCARDERIRETFGMPLDENIQLCDIVICGNSTVTVELLRGGVPVLYDASLDSLPYDYNGYIKRGLVLPAPLQLDASVLQAAGAFYGGPSWVGTMRYFDAGYLQDEDAMLEGLDDTIRELTR